MMLSGRVLFVVATFLCLSCQTTIAQDFLSATDILPPPPSATAMIKHDGITVSKNTGVANISIPLYTLKGRKLSIAVGLDYSSSGIRVDEIASQVGMGWSLQAGGVVTRTVRGLPDESNQRIVAPSTGIGDDTASYHFLSHISSSTSNTGHYDSEPDLFNFSFGGFSGSFVLDTAMQVVLIHAAPVRISYNFTATGWNFKITDPQGIMYFFGGSTATEKTKKDQTCGKLFDTYVPVAWHLIKIQHPNGETILLNYTSLEYIYDTGIAQTMNYGSQTTPQGGTLGTCAQTPCSVPANVNCEHLLHTQGVLLSSIYSPGNAGITFSYTDRQDYHYGKLVQRIYFSNLVGGTSIPIGYWDLKYNQQQADMSYAHRTESYTQYTPYLVSAVQTSIDSAYSLPYYFTYLDPGGRPCRLSYSQDHWGYFNGKNNSTLVPPPSDPTLIQWLPQATANRGPDPAYTSKGMLSKIVYPTGGLDSLVYEPNVMSSSSSTAVATKHQANGTVTGSGLKDQGIINVPFSVDQGQYLHVTMNCQYNGGTIDSLHDKCRFDITGSSGSITTPYVTLPGNTLVVDVHAYPGTYNIQVTANGAVATGNVTLEYYPLHFSSPHPANTIAAGLRIREILTANPGEKAILKRYYYGELNTPDISSLQGTDVPIYNKAMATRYFCQDPLMGTSYVYLFCQYTSLFSSTLGNLYDFQSFPVSYVSVIESLGGDNFEKGGIQTRFLSGPDSYGPILGGEQIFSSPKSNFSSFLNGKVIEEFTFMKPDHQTIVPLSRKLYTYKIDSRKEPTVSGYSVNAKYFNNAVPDWNCQVYNGSSCAYDIDNYNAAFDVMRYDIFSSWVYNDTLTEYVYSGNTTLSKTTRNYYDDTSNLQLSRTETYDSKRNLLKTFYKYPHDYAGQVVYDAMTAQNIVTPLVDMEKDNGTTKLMETRANFTSWGNGNFQPSSFQTAYATDVLKNIGTITKYDAAGNILEYTGADGITNAVFWGFGNLYPVTKITGAGYDQARALLTVDTSVLNTLSGTALLTQINGIRQNLPAAQVIAYDYQPQTGVLSITDMNNRAAYYDYDSFRRLIDTKDKDANIVKQVRYHYIAADPNATFVIYTNTTRGVTLMPTSCAPGYTGTAVGYGVPAGRYFSAVSQDAANAQADAEIAAFAQDYVNNHSLCTLTYGGPHGPVF